jgi:hypothetical protein
MIISVFDDEDFELLAVLIWLRMSIKPGLGAADSDEGSVVQVWSVPVMSIHFHSLLCIL